MKIILTLLIMLGSIFGVFLYFYIYSLFLKEDEKYLTIPYGSMFLGLILVLVFAFLEIYSRL